LWFGTGPSGGVAEQRSAVVQMGGEGEREKEREKDRERY
jgi:hypothetical protein